MNCTDKLQRDALADEIVEPIKNGGEEIGRVHYVLLHQHHRAFNLLLLSLGGGLILNLPAHAPQ